MQFHLFFSSWDQVLPLTVLELGHHLSLPLCLFAPALSYVTAFQMNAWDEGQVEDANPAQITEQIQLIQRVSLIQSPVLSFGEGKWLLKYGQQKQ